MVEVGLGHRWGKGSSGTKWIWRLLVGGALLAFTALLIMIGQRDRNWNHIEIQEGQQQTVHLSGDQRVSVQGEARFAFIDPDARFTFKNVARLTQGYADFSMNDNATGFVVETPAAQIVVQTGQVSFSVDTSADTTRVRVERGAVSLAPAERQNVGRRVETGETSRTTSTHIIGE